MRRSSLFAAGLLAAGLALFQQLPANSAAKSKLDPDWSAKIAMDDGEPQEVAPQSFEALRAKLAPDDPAAVLEAIGYALAQVGDGSSYVWHRTDGPLMGNVRIVSSFRDETGAVCRKLALTLILGDLVRPSEATACRDSGGHWVLNR